MAAPSPRTIVCDVCGLAPDAATVDALARLQVAARRGGYELRLRGASGELLALLDLCGLCALLPVEPCGESE